MKGEDDPWQKRLIDAFAERTPSEREQFTIAEALEICTRGQQDETPKSKDGSSQ